MLNKSALVRSLVFVVLTLFAVALPSRATDKISWQDLKPDLFGDRGIKDGADVLRLDVPSRPQDAGLVPTGMTILRPQSADWYVRTLTLVVDRNPVPLAATFRLGKTANISQIVTRIRIDQYSDMRVIAEASDGELYMVSRFVKATGGCSAPAVSGSGDDAVAQMGEMRLRQHDILPGEVDPARRPESRALVLQIRHPNHSGFQKDPLQGYFIPAHFVDSVEIRQGEAPVLTVEGGISLSENPSIRFDFVPGPGGDINVQASDTEGNRFGKSWALAPFLQRDSALRHNR